MKLIYAFLIPLIIFNHCILHSMEMPYGVKQTHTKKVCGPGKVKEVIVSQPIAPDFSYFTRVCDKMIEGVGIGVGKGLEASLAQAVLKVILTLFDECSIAFHGIINPKAKADILLQKKIAEHSQYYLLLENLSQQTNDPATAEQLEDAKNKNKLVLATLINIKLSADIAPKKELPSTLPSLPNPVELSDKREYALEIPPLAISYNEAEPSIEIQEESVRKDNNERELNSLPQVNEEATTQPIYTNPTIDENSANEQSDEN